MPIKRPAKKAKKESWQAELKRAYQSVFDPHNPDAQKVLEHMMKTLGVTQYIGGVTLEELTRADERRRFGFSILRQLNLSEEFIRAQSEQQLTYLEERLYDE